MKLTFLGTGTSTGVPQIGCDCEVCRSEDPRDKRLRTAALIETDGGERLLIDCGPDFRAQMLSVPFGRLDGVLITHHHYDHTGGLDDVRPFCKYGDVPVYADDDTLAHIRGCFPYCFVEHKYPGVPKIRLNEIKAGEAFEIGQTKIEPFCVMHGKLPILAFRIGPLAYITDMKTIDTDWLERLKGIDTLVVNGLRHTPHGSHQTIEEAIAFARQTGATHTYLTHLCHHAGRHQDLEATLPEGIHVAYDGQAISIG